MPQPSPVPTAAPLAPGSSAYYALLFLPSTTQQALTAFHAYCREVRGVVDTVSDAGVASAKLTWWKTEIQRAYEGQAQHPIARALGPHLIRAEIDPRLLQAVVEGARTDLEQTRFFDFPGLRHYCQHAGGIPMEVAVRLLGQSQTETLRYAHALGVALQLAGIVRDVGAHAAQGRIYLPVNELQQFEVKAQDILNRSYSPGFGALMAFQCQRARQSLAEAVTLLPQADRRAQKPGLILARIAHTLLDEIERSDCQVPVSYTHLTLPTTPYV